MSNQIFHSVAFSITEQLASHKAAKEKMESSVDTDMEELSEILLQFHKHLVKNNSLSVYKVPNSNAIPAQEITPQNITLNKELRGSQSSAEVELLDSEARCNTPQRKAVIIDNNNCTSSDASNEREPITTSTSQPRNLPASTTVKPKIYHENTLTPSSLCSVISNTKTTLPQGNMGQGEPGHPRMSHSQQPSCFYRNFRLRDTRKTPKKKCNISFIQNCHPKIAQNATFQHLSSMNSLLNNGSELTRGSPTVRGEPGQFSPPILSTDVSSTKKCKSVKKTKITVSLPPMSDSTENQLITIFIEISKLHGCDVSVDKKETAMRNEPNTAYLASHHTASCQQSRLATSVKQNKSQQPTGTQHKSASSYPDFSKLRALQAQLHSFGTQLHVMQPQQESQQQQPQQLQESSDFDGTLPIYTEVIMQSTPPKSSVTETA